MGLIKWDGQGKHSGRCVGALGMGWTQCWEIFTLSSSSSTPSCNTAPPTHTPTTVTKTPKVPAAGKLRTAI